MSQANRPDTMIPTRRALLAGAPAVAAAALAAGTAVNILATASAAPPGDAELLALKPLFDPLFDRWRKMSIEQRAGRDNFEVLLREKTGMTRTEAYALDQDGPEREAYDKKLFQCIGAARDWPSHYDREAWEPHCDQFHAVAGEILDHIAMTREGLALQARAFISSYSELWECETHAGLDEFIECVCAFAGVSFPPYGDVIPEIIALPSDPIFAIIAEHRTAQEALHVACEANDLDVEDDPNKQAADKRAIDADLPLFTTAPTTVAGVVALLEYVHSPCHDQWQGPDKIDTVLSYARGSQRRAMKEAVRGFDAHILVALRNIAGGVQS